MMTEITLSQDQEVVKTAILEFINNRGLRKFITVGGYAGTGKTFLLGHVAHLIGHLRVAFVAYTGKAASVLAGKLDSFDYCGTIHSLIYAPIMNEKGEIIGWTERKDARGLADRYDLIVIDEASMVSEDIFKDLLEYEIPIIAVGDHGQLPPVKSKFNLMQKPMYRLEKVHRQAEENPIIKLSMMARNDGAIPFGDFGAGVRKVKGLEHLNEIELDDTLVLCGTNRTRQQINTLALEGRKEPQVGDKVICLKNNAKKGIYNGMVGFVEAIEKCSTHWFVLGVRFEDGTHYSGQVLKYQFGDVKTLHDWRVGSAGPGDLFDWAYCLTVHKSQGSEADSVVLIEENQPWLEDNWKRWLYTGVTRARKELLVIKP